MNVRNDVWKEWDIETVDDDTLTGCGFPPKHKLLFEYQKLYHRNKDIEAELRAIKDLFRGLVN